MNGDHRSKRSWKVWIAAGCALVLLTLLAAGPLRHHYALWRARQAIADRHPEQALEWLEAARESHDRDGRVDLLMARAYRHLERYDKTMESLDRARQNGASTDAIEREKLLAMAESARLAPDDPRLEILLDNPGEDAAEVFESLVKGYYRLYEFGPAMLVLDTWEQYYPRDPEPHVYRGLLSEHNERFAEAECWFRQAAEMAVHRVDIRLALARVLRKQHRYREALAHYRVALDKQSSVEALFGMGKCLQAKGRIDEARQTLLAGLDQQPDNYDCLLALGEMSVDAGKGQAALRWLEAAMKLKPREYDVRYALGKALMFSGDGDRAKMHFQFAAQARLALSRVKELRRSVAVDPGDAGLRYEIGVALLRFGDASEGLKWLRSVFDYQPDHRPAHAALAEYFAAQGNHRAAARHHALAQPDP